MTDDYAVSLPYAADVSLLSIFSGSKAQLGSMLTGQNKLRNVALDAEGGELSAFIFLSGGSQVSILLSFGKSTLQDVALDAQGGELLQLPVLCAACQFSCNDCHPSHETERLPLPNRRPEHKA
jgi:hypothetical protein